MNWRWKAKIQNLVALLPTKLSTSTYYWIQKRFGEHNRMNTIDNLLSGIQICAKIEQAGQSPVEKTFFEIGTGKRINIPLSFWLAGARQITTVDLNHYLKEELVREDLNYIQTNRDEIEQLFEGVIYNNRLDSLLDFTSKQWRLAGLLKFLNIEYIAPGDAAKLPISTDSIDFYTSYTVLEHIPLDNLKMIIEEGNRIIKKGGLFINLIDYSDHFSHSDRSISSINFLQFSVDKWNKIAGNRFMYMNRLRVDDYHDLFKEMKHKILISDSQIDFFALDLIKTGELKIDKAFVSKSKENLATTGYWIISEYCG